MERIKPIDARPEYYFGKPYKTSPKYYNPKYF